MAGGLIDANHCGLELLRSGLPQHRVVGVGGGLLSRKDLDIRGTLL